MAVSAACTLQSNVANQKGMGGLCHRAGVGVMSPVDAADAAGGVICELRAASVRRMCVWLCGCPCGAMVRGSSQSVCALRGSGARVRVKGSAGGAAQGRILGLSRFRADQNCEEGIGYG